MIGEPERDLGVLVVPRAGRLVSTGTGMSRSGSRPPRRPLNSARSSPGLLWRRHRALAAGVRFTSSHLTEHGCRPSSSNSGKTQRLPASRTASRPARLATLWSAWFSRPTSSRSHDPLPVLNAVNHAPAQVWLSKEAKARTLKLWARDYSLYREAC